MEKFELWVTNNESLLPSETVQLFRESIRCCKFEIDRQAYLLAYQGMMFFVREKICSVTTPPRGFLACEWEQIKRDVSNDRVWDFNTYDRLKQQPTPIKAAVINIPEDIRNMLDFWRELRNTCAHYKRFHFIKAHTIAFYSFISQYLLQMTVEGSVMTLLDEIDDFFNPSKTTPGSNPDSLIKKIPKMVAREDDEKFFIGLRDIIQKKYKIRGGYSDFIWTVYNSSGEEMKRRVMEFFKSHVDLRNYIINKYPEAVLTFLESPQEIREYWYNILPESLNRVRILSLLLTSDKIDNPQEAIKHILKSMYDQNFNIWDIEEQYVESLGVKGYFNVFLEDYFDVSFTGNISNMSKICYRQEFYMSHLNFIPIDEKFVQRIIDVFSVSSPYTLNDRFRDVIMGVPEKREAIEKVITEMGKTLPEKIRPKNT